MRQHPQVWLSAWLSRERGVASSRWRLQGADAGDADWSSATALISRAPRAWTDDAVRIGAARRPGGPRLRRPRLVGCRRRRAYLASGSPSGIVAAYSVVGERQQGTLEPVLTTPIRREEDMRRGLDDAWPMNPAPLADCDQGDVRTAQSVSFFAAVPLAQVRRRPLPEPAIGNPIANRPVAPCDERD